MSDSISILHVVPGDSAYCRALCGPEILNRSKLAGRALRHNVLVCGAGFSAEAFATVAGNRAVSIHPRELQAEIRRLRPDIVQCWGCTLAVDPPGETVIDVGGDPDTLVLPCADSPGQYRLPSPSAHIVTSCHALQHRLVESGQPFASVHRIASTLAHLNDTAIVRNQARSRLSLEETHCGVLVLPPADAHAAGFTAVWAALLVAQIHKTLRIILPELGADSDRLRALVAATKFEHLLAVPSAGMDWMSLLHAADVGIQLHAPLCGASGLDELRSLGRPVVTPSDYTVDSVTDGGPVFRCERREPKPAAAALLQAVDHWAARTAAGSCTVPEFAAEYMHRYAQILSIRDNSA